MALSVVIILRITATMTTFGFFPVAARRSWNALSAGFPIAGAQRRHVEHVADARDHPRCNGAL